MMNMKRFAVSIIALTIFAPVVHAVDRGQTSADDYRIRTVEYNPMDTVKVNGIAGLAIHVTVAPDEKYVTHVFGEKGGWTFSHVENNFFFRPQAEESDTNLTIVTNKRTYHLLLHYIGSYTAIENGKKVKKFIHSPWSMRQATVALKYKYPNEDMKHAQKALEARRVEKALSGSDDSDPVNLRYRMSQSPPGREIQPLNVWDNYNRTFFKFARNAPLPTIFAIGPNGKESVVNVQVQGDHRHILVAKQTAKQWRIRYGDEVVGVINDGYNPSIGGNPSGTVSSQVERTLKEQDGGGS